MAVTKEKNLQPVLTELHRAFNLFNKHFYDNKLPQVVIAIRSQGKRVGVMGWFTPAKVWTDGNQDMHEIVITAETLNRDYIDIMRTLHHEMIHLYCETNGIKDTSRNGAYHNKEFKQACIRHGFWYPEDKPHPKIGWSMAELTDTTVKKIHSWKINSEVFGVARKSFGDGEKEKKKKKTNIIKWTCPKCGDIVRSSKADLYIKCFRPNEDGEMCDMLFVPEIPEGFIGKLGGEDDEEATA